MKFEGAHPAKIALKKKKRRKVSYKKLSSEKTVEVKM